MYGELLCLCDLPGYVHTTRGCMGQGVGHATAVANDVKTFVAGLQILIDVNFHVVEFDLNAIKQGVVIGSTRSDLIQGIDHLDDAVQDTFWKNQA